MKALTADQKPELMDLLSEGLEEDQISVSPFGVSRTTKNGGSTEGLSLRL